MASLPTPRMQRVPARQAVDIARSFINELADGLPNGLIRRCHRGKHNDALARGEGDWPTIAAIEAGQDRMRRIVHGQEVADELERHGWCGNEERLLHVHRVLSQEGLVERDLLRPSEAPRWCKVHGRTLFAGPIRPHHDLYIPACCWWVVNDAQQ